MQAAHKFSTAGEFLRRTRKRLGLTTRQVADLSKAIATQQGREELSISHASLVQIENEQSVPGVFKLYSLSAIYGLSLTDLLAQYLDVDGADRLHVSLQHAGTHLMSFAAAHRSDNTHSTAAQAAPEKIESTTTLLSPLETEGADVRLLAVGRLGGCKYRYGMIGTSDYMMYPLIRPGSLIEIQECQKPAPRVECRTEFDRPIYFIETRTAYLCSWCELVGGTLLVLIPHPLSPCRIQQYAYPSEAEVIGRVTGVVVRFTATGAHFASCTGARPDGDGRSARVTRGPSAVEIPQEEPSRVRMLSKPL